MDTLLGRKREVTELQRLYNSTSSEFVVIYGRRRVGKTFLIRNFFNNDFVFSVTGVARGNRTEQLLNFHSSLIQYGSNCEGRVLQNWFEAFAELKHIIEKSNKTRKVIFLDELPWMDTTKSEFIKALELFWNGWASVRSDVLLVVCGSAASWMVKNIIRNKGGLHNRLTFKLKINPFTLSETRQYLENAGISWDNMSIAECYMILGGIPYYLHLLDKRYSLAQNVDRLFFQESALLEDEFENLYASLFKNSTEYVKIIETLSKKKSGFTRKEISDGSKISDGGGLTRKLEELEQCGFIRKYKSKGEVSNIYQLIDFYSLFYFQFLKDNKSYDRDVWMHLTGTHKYVVWCGLSFERLCLAHLEEIKKTLGISGILTSTGSYYSKEVQIDMIIDRADKSVTVCEMKYFTDQYAITKAEWEKIEKRISTVRRLYPRKSCFLVMVTANGLVKNDYAINYVQGEVKLEDIMITLAHPT